MFVKYINDLDKNVDVSKFADDTKMSGNMDSEEGCQGYSRIQTVGNLSGKMTDEIESGKCEVINFGKSNAMGKYIAYGRTFRIITVMNITLGSAMAQR